GHSMRRSSATLLANAGGDILTLKRHGRWRSSTVVEGYIEDSESSKIDIAKRIQGTSRTIQRTPSTSEIVVPNLSFANINTNETNEPGIKNPNNIQFDINVNVNVNV